MSHFSFCKMTPCRLTSKHKTAHKYTAKQRYLSVCLSVWLLYIFTVFIYWFIYSIFLHYCKPTCSNILKLLKRPPAPFINNTVIYSIGIMPPIPVWPEGLIHITGTVIFSLSKQRWKKCLKLRRKPWQWNQSRTWAAHIVPDDKVVDSLCVIYVVRCY